MLYGIRMRDANAGRIECGGSAVECFFSSSSSTACCCFAAAEEGTVERVAWRSEMARVVCCWSV